MAQKDLTTIIEKGGLKNKIETWLSEVLFVIYSSGKVGTFTLKKTLFESGITQVHAHSLIRTYKGLYFLENLKISRSDKIKYYYLSFLKRLKLILLKVFRKEINILCGVRDPFSRTISAFFEQGDFIDKEFKNFNQNKLINLFHKHRSIAGSIDWFEIEFKKALGINIFNYQFDSTKGFQIIREGKFNIFLFRIDKLDNIQEELSQFIGAEKLSLTRDNTNASSEEYKTFMKNYKYSKSDVSYIKNSIFFQHFWDKNDRESIISRWS